MDEAQGEIESRRIISAALDWLKLPGAREVVLRIGKTEAILENCEGKIWVWFTVSGNTKWGELLPSEEVEGWIMGQIESLQEKGIYVWK